MTVLVIGGAGYVGSHMVHALVDAGDAKPGSLAGLFFEVFNSIRMNKANKAQIAKDCGVSNFIQTRFSHRT